MLKKKPFSRLKNSPFPVKCRTIICTQPVRLQHYWGDMTSSYGIFMTSPLVPDHCDVTGSSLWCHDAYCLPLVLSWYHCWHFIPSLTTSSWQHMADPCIVGICTTISHSTISHSTISHSTISQYYYTPVICSPNFTMEFNEEHTLSIIMALRPG